MLEHVRVKFFLDHFNLWLKKKKPLKLEFEAGISISPLSYLDYSLLSQKRQFYVLKLQFQVHAAETIKVKNKEWTKKGLATKRENCEGGFQNEQ